MLRQTGLALYGLAFALATPALALDDALLTGAMSGLETVATEAPAVTSYTRADGTEGQLSDHAGHVAVVNFWATWCAPCRAEMPSLQALQDRLGEDGLDVVTVAFGRHNSAAMRRFWDEAGVTTLPLNVDPRSELARALGVEGLPTTVILDRSGRVVARLTGEADWDAPESVAVMRALLAQD